jgi:uncharacterized membrane protein
MDLNIAALEAGDNCNFYREQREYEATQMRRITWVIFAVIITLAASLIGLIIAITLQSWGATTATAVGSVVSGTAMKFIINQRHEHRRRMDRWVRAIEKAGCPEP